MSFDSKQSFWGPFFTGAFLMFVAIIAFRSMAPRQPQPPSLGGQKLPTKSFQIDFTKRYKIVCSGYQAKKDAIVYSNVKILGFVGEDEAKASGGGSFGSYYGHFNRWLVLELKDLRKVYLPSSSISIIEEVKTKQLAKKSAASAME